MGRTCLACGEALEGDRRRKYCDDACKMRFHRGARAEPDRESSVEGMQSTEAATMLALAESGKLGTPSGQALLVLARRIDSSHRDTGGGLASMVKRLQETLTDLTADVKPDADAVDELKARRDLKRTAASG